MTVNSGHAGLSYRPDIDGLRALAVLPVLLFHSSVPGFGGGFIGVDIFFVISGYLITSVIRADQTAGVFTIKRFYEKRIRRIAPALLVMILTVLVFAALLMLPSDLMYTARSAISSVAFVSNMFFWRTGGYFGGAEEQKALLHTWSLSVEEQFYIFFPILMILTWKWARRSELAVIAVLAVTSLVMSIVLIHVNKVLPAFFLFPPRAWEMLLGAALAMGAVPRIESRLVRSIAAAVGLIAILAPVFLFSSRSPFPGALALIPCVGTALIIASGRDGSHVLSPVIGSRPLIWIGLISYSLYLWHWPVLVFSRYFLIRELNAVETVAAIALMFVLAWGSWRFIETPVRRARLGFKALFSGFAVASVVTAAACFAVVVTDGLPRRFVPLATEINAAGGTMYKCSISDYMVFGSYYACPVNLGGAGPEAADVVIWGDSHAQMYVPGIRDALVDANLKGVLVPLNGCPPLADRAPNRSCLGINEANLARISALPAKTVLIAMNWKSYGNRSYVGGPPSEPQAGYGILLGSLERTVDALKVAGKHVVIVGPVATPEYNMSSELSRSVAYHRSFSKPLGEDRASFEARMQPVLSFLEVQAGQGVDVIYPHRIMCDADRCSYVVGGVPAFADGHHLTGKFATGLKGAFLPTFASSPSGRAG